MIQETMTKEQLEKLNEQIKAGFDAIARDFNFNPNKRSDQEILDDIRKEGKGL